MGNFDLQDFVKNPTVDNLGDLRKDDWCSLASYYKVPIKSYWKKSKIRSEVVNALVEQKVLDDSAYDLCEEEESLVELKKLEMQEKERERGRKRKRKKVSTPNNGERN